MFASKRFSRLSVFAFEGGNLGRDSSYRIRSGHLLGPHLQVLCSSWQACLQVGQVSACGEFRLILFQQPLHLRLTTHYVIPGGQQAKHLRNGREDVHDHPVGRFGAPKPLRK